MLLCVFTSQVEIKIVDCAISFFFPLTKINLGGSFSFILIVILKYSLLLRSVWDRRDWSETKQREKALGLFCFPLREKEIFFQGYTEQNDLLN